MGKGKGAGKGKGNGSGGFVDVFQEMEDAMKCGVCCICMMLIGGPICMLMGISYIEDSTIDSRGMAITNFKSYVSAWGAARELFDDQAFTVLSPDTVPRPLRKFESGDLQQDELVGAGADLGSKSVDGDTSWAAWTPLFYQAQVTVPGITVSGGRPIELHDTSVSDTEAVWTDRAGLAACKQDVVNVEPCSDTCSSSRRRRSGSSSSCTTCSSKCSSQGGDWQSSKRTCSRHLTLTEVNLVASGSRGAWVFSGLAYTLPEHTDGSGVATHRPVDGGTYTSAPGSCPTPFHATQVPLVVRSENDPVVKAAQLTDYTFDFGNTQAENATIGSTLLIIGIVVTALPCCGAFAVYKLIITKRSSQQNQLGVPTSAQTMGSAPGSYAPPQMGMQPMVANAANPIYSGQPGMAKDQTQYQQPMAPQGGLPMATATAVPIPMATATAIPMNQQQQQQPALVASAPPAF